MTGATDAEFRMEGSGVIAVLTKIDLRWEVITYQELPKVFEPFFSANRSSCAALNYRKSRVSVHPYPCAPQISLGAL